LANARIVPDVDMPGSSVVTQDVNCALEDAQQKFEELAALAEEAVKTSVWCTCETSGRNSLTSDFLECCVCRVRCCRDCTGMSREKILSIAGMRIPVCLPFISDILQAQRRATR
jgi:hypothetical protein